MSPEPTALYTPKIPQVLMVDDQPANLTALAAVLEPLGFPLVAESSGEGALRRLLHEEFAVVLLDVQMPGIDGFDTAKMIHARERTRHLPIIFVTAINRDRAHVFRGYQEGAVDYLTKPLDPDVLRSKVSVFIQLYEKTQTIRAQDALLHRQQQEAWKNDLVSAMSHELRTPLNAILSWTQLIRGGELDEPQRNRGLEIIERNARLQAELIADVLDVSRAVTGALELDVTPLDLPALVQAEVTAVGSLAESKEVVLQVDLESVPDGFVGDALRLSQVVRKLLLNGIQFTPKGGRVEVRLRETKQGVEVVVTDTGQGILASMLPHIFDRFGRSPAERRAPRGLGLGLYLAQHLCQLHRGKITAESPGEGLGATFTVQLPYPGRSIS